MLALRRLDIVVIFKAAPMNKLLYTFQKAHKPPHITFLLCGWLLAIGFGVLPTVADDPPASGNDLVTIRVVSDVLDLQPGHQFTLAVEYSIKPGWHLYWRNPGANGMAPTVEVTAPDGFEIGELIFPRPQIFGTGATATYGYEGTVLLMVPVKCPPQLDAVEVQFELTLDWVVCKVACLLGESQQRVRLPVSLPGREVTPNPAGARLITSWMSRVPRPMTAGARTRGFTAEMAPQNRLVLKGVSGASSSAIYIPGGTPGVSPKAPGPVSGVLSNGSFIFEIPMSIIPEDSLGEPLRANGLILLGSYERPRALEIDVSVDSSEVRRENSEG